MHESRHHDRNDRDFRLIPLGKFAEQAHLHHTTVRRMIRRGELPIPIRVGNRLLFDLADLHDWLAAAKASAAAEHSGGCVLELPRG